MLGYICNLHLFCGSDISAPNLQFVFDIDLVFIILDEAQVIPEGFLAKVGAGFQFELAWRGYLDVVQFRSSWFHRWPLDVRQFWYSESRYNNYL